MAIGFALTGVIALGVAVLFLFVFNDSNKAAVDIPNSDSLVGVQTGPAPWNAALDTLPDRLKPLGLNALTTEGEVVVKNLVLIAGALLVAAALPPLRRKSG